MLAAIIVAISVILDQVSKHLVVQNIELHGTVPFIPNFMSFYHTRNTGAAFSMLSNNRWVFMIMSVFAMGVMIWLLIKEYKRHPLMTVSLAMVLGGGIGNMIDRVRLGYVVDFFKTEFIDFAIFNVADCFVSVGAVLLAVYVMFYDSKVEAAKKAEKSPEVEAEND
jgi:signal peptidase II